MTLERLENESDDALIYRICSLKDKIGTWKDVAGVINGITGNQYDESAYRKKFQIYNTMSESNGLEDIKMARRELEAEKIKFRDERNAWQKQNYVNARVGQKLDYLEEQFKSFGERNFPTYNSVSLDGDNDMLIILSDFHIGQCFSSVFGSYNADIATERLTQLLGEVKKIQKLHDSKNLYISIQGDMLSGNIHKTIAITNRENVIDQIKIVTELLTAFIYEVSKLFEKTFVSNVSGNHSRIDRKDEALHDERLDDLIGWIVKNFLSHVPNIIFKDNILDTGISGFNIRGKDYLSVHGDYDAFTDNGVSKLCMMLGSIPYAILYGHLHSPALMESHGVKMIRGGSLSGAGDDYTLEKRISGKPSQMVCICDENGLKCCYPIELK